MDLFRNNPQRRSLKFGQGPLFFSICRSLLKGLWLESGCSLPWCPGLTQSAAAVAVLISFSGLGLERASGLGKP